jgi:GNAT superfamily N-acetyltransferase
VEVVIRAGRADEITRLGDVERDGDRRYHGYEGVPAGFEDTVAPATLLSACEEGRLWVATSGVGGEVGSSSDDGDIVGFALAEAIDGNAHLEQLSVRLGFQGRGVGGRLITTVSGWAAHRGLAAVTLCTFADVDWNRPFYEHLGFAVVPEGRWTPGLRAAFESDGQLGLDLSRRVVMRLKLPVG